MFKRTNVNKVNKRAGSPFGGDEEEDDDSFFQKPTSIDFEVVSPNTLHEKSTPFQYKNIEEANKKDKDASFISNKSDASKKGANTSTVNKTPAKTQEPQKQAESAQKSHTKTPSNEKVVVNQAQSNSKTPQKVDPVSKTPQSQNKSVVVEKTSANQGQKTPQSQIKETTVSSEKKTVVQVEKKVVNVGTEVVKRSAPPPAKVNYDNKKGPVIAASTNKDLKKAPTIVKSISTKRVDDSWRILNSHIKNQEPHNAYECEIGSYEDILGEAKKSRQKFTDNIFVPSISSLCNNPKQVKALYQDFNKWVRIPDLYKGQEHCISHSIDPNDIKQGELGNCYFLSALSSLAEKPERIQRLFEDQDINDQGCYYVRLCVDGIWRYIVVDDFTPCSLNNRPVFAQPRTEEGIVEFWVLLIEKAWAKIFGSYENIDAGFPEDVLFACTGAPSNKIETEDPDAFERLMAADKANFIMTAACGQDDMKLEAFEKLGLVPDHAYSLLGVREIKHPKEGKVRLCEIRNPWGWASEEWNGKWCDSYKGWNDIPDIKKSLDLKDDGRFMMSFEDFKTYFDYVTVCRMHNDYYYVSYPIKMKNNSYSIRTFTLTEQGSFYLSLTQKDERYFRSSKTINYSYKVARIVLGKKNGDSFEYIDGTCDECKNLTLTAEDMEPGDYYVVVAVDSGDQQMLWDHILSYYGSQDITFERVRYKDDSGVLEKIMVGGGKGQVISTEKKKDFEYNCLVSLEEGLIIETYENLGSNELTINKDYSKLDKGKYVVLREEQSSRFKIKVMPNDIGAVCSKILNIYDPLDSKAMNELKNFGFKNID